MQLFPHTPDPIISIQFKPQELICSWIKPTSATTFALKGYQKTTLHNLALEYGLIFNPTIITRYIANFIEQNNLSSALGAFSITGAAIREQLIATKEKPTFADLKIADESQWLWDATYLYTDAQQRAVHYVCAMKKSTLFMYQLLAINVSLPVITISTERMALFALYKSVHAHAFRATQLSVDMQRHNNMIEQIFSAEMAFRLLSGNLSVNQRVELLPACGLYTMMETQ